MAPLSQYPEEPAESVESAAYETGECRGVDRGETRRIVVVIELM
jgi:hypothetical protein